MTVGSADSEDRGSDASCGVYRCAGQTDAYQMNKGKSSRDEQSGVLGSALVVALGNAEDNKNEHEGENDLGQQSADEVQITEAVCSEGYLADGSLYPVAVHVGVGKHTAEHQYHMAEGGDKRADDLTYRVADSFADLHSAVKEHCE